MNDYFLEIKKFIKAGKSSKAKELLQDVLVKIKKTPLERIQISKFYESLSDYSNAVKILGSIYSKDELEHASKDGLALQIRLGHMLNRIGAKYVALNIFQNVSDICNTRNIDILNVSKSFYTYRANLDLMAYDFESARENFTKSLKSEVKDNYYYPLLKIGLADALEGCGKSLEAISKIDEVLKECNDEDQFIKGICHQAKGEYYFKLGEFSKSKNSFEESLKFFSNKNNTKDKAYLLQWWGALDYSMGNKEEAKEKLMQAFSILNVENSQPQAILGVLYWLEKVSPNDVGIGRMISLRAHPCFSPYRFLLGQPLHKSNKIPLHPWFHERYEHLENDCWIIDDKSIGPMNYFRDQREVCENAAENTVLDLYSGLIIEKKGVKVLTEIEASCLTALFAASDLGINIWALTDFIYRQALLNPHDGMERIKERVKQLKRKGFKIYRKKNKYFIDYDFSKAKVVLPMGIRTQDKFNYIRLYKDNFKRKDLEELYGIGQTTASRWIQEWLSKKVISNEESGKASSYSFNIRKAS